MQVKGHEEKELLFYGIAYELYCCQRHRETSKSLTIGVMISGSQDLYFKRHFRSLERPPQGDFRQAGSTGSFVSIGPGAPKCDAEGVGPRASSSRLARATCGAARLRKQTAWSLLRSGSHRDLKSPEDLELQLKSKRISLRAS